MTINLDPSIKVALSDSVENLEGPVIIHLDKDLTLNISEQQAADLIDQLSENMEARTGVWELTEEGKAWLEQQARN